MKKIISFLLLVVSLLILSLSSCTNDNQGNLPQKVIIGTQTLVAPEAISTS